MSEQPATGNAPPGKYAGLGGAAITSELMIGFWLGIGVILAVGVADSLNHCIGSHMSSRTQ